MKKIVKILVLTAALILVLLAAGYIVEQKKGYKIDEHLKGRVNLIVVEKYKRQLSIYHNDELLKTYKISLGKNPVGHKQFEGDSKTPEGIYFIDGKNPKSKYFLNLGISYPNEKDKEYAAQYNKSAGGDIKIHGLPNGFSMAKPLFDIYGDWTEGCIAVSNEDIAELYEIIDIGTKIEIKP